MLCSACGLCSSSASPGLKLESTRCPFGGFISIGSLVVSAPTTDRSRSPQIERPRFRMSRFCLTSTMNGRVCRFIVSTLGRNDLHNKPLFFCRAELYRKMPPMGKRRFGGSASDNRDCHSLAKDAFVTTTSRITHQDRGVVRRSHRLCVADRTKHRIRPCRARDFGARHPAACGLERLQDARPQP